MINRCKTSRFGWLAVAGILAAVSVSTVHAAPKATVSPESIELGEIEEGNTFERFINLKNDGDGILVLEDLKTSCGCTAASIEGTLEIGPGESQDLRITFNSKNFEGKISKKVTVVTNDPEVPRLEVPLHADVHKPVRWEPKYVQLNKVQMNETFVDTVSVQADRDLNVEIHDAFVLGGASRLEPTKLFDLKSLGQRVDGERDVFDFEVRLREDSAPQKLSEQLIVVTNQESPRDSLRIAVRGEVVGRIKIYPSFVVMPTVTPGREAVKDVMLRATDGTFRVTNAEVSESPVVVEIIPQNEGRQTLIRLRYTGEDAASTGVRSLKVMTDDKHQPLIELPVRYRTQSLNTGAGSSG